MVLLVIIIIIIAIIFRSSQTNMQNSATPRPGIPDVQADIHELKHKFSSVNDPIGRLSLYEKVLQRDHYSTVASVAKELHLSRTQVISDIRELQKNGYLKDVCLSKDNIHITYHHNPNHPRSPYTPEPSVSTRIHVKGKMGLNADHIETLQSNQQTVTCSYCGAQNIVPAGSSDYHCYFCWEQL